MPDVVILSQGDELTTGQTTDTNASWLAGELWQLGLPVRRVITVPDRLDDLAAVVREAASLAPIVIGTGGLGPTRDDLTAEAVALAIGRPLELDAAALGQVEARYARWGRTMAEPNRKQAMLPQGAEVLENRWGTAPGFVVEALGARMFFMPGVPREMKRMFAAWLEPDLRARFAATESITHSVRVIGVAESELEAKLRALQVPGLAIGFRTKMPENQVKLRFDGGVSPEDRAAAVAEARRLIGWRAFGVDCGDLAEEVGARLVGRDETLALAESCTVGRLAHWVGGVPGASRYLLEGAVLYSNAAKTRTAGVPEAVLAEHGAVSEAVARQLAAGIRDRAGSTWGLGITGVAGPGGGSSAKPVGTVHIALQGPEVQDHRRFQFPGNRERVTQFAAAAALMMLFKQVG